RQRRERQHRALIRHHPLRRVLLRDSHHRATLISSRRTVLRRPHYRLDLQRRTFLQLAGRLPLLQVISDRICLPPCRILIALVNIILRRPALRSTLRACHPIHTKVMVLDIIHHRVILKTSYPLQITIINIRDLPCNPIHLHVKAALSCNRGSSRRKFKLNLANNKHCARLVFRGRRVIKVLPLVYQARQAGLCSVLCLKPTRRFFSTWRNCSDSSQSLRLATQDGSAVMTNSRIGLAHRHVPVLKL
ncbi:hypothetical protein LTS18_013048, partial [Coniosporium uncinatum]